MLAYLALFAWSALAATLVPIGSEAAVVLMVRAHYSPAAIVVVATLGNYAGACTTYWLARGARAALVDGDEPRQQARAARVLARFGPPALLFTWVPLVGDALVVVAGFTGVAFVPFSVWTALGKFLRYVAVVWGALALVPS